MPDPELPPEMAPGSTTGPQAAEQQYFNLVTFTTYSGGEKLYLTLEEDWTVAAGIEPSVNTAIVPYTEFAKLTGEMADVLGYVEFWFHRTPGQTDGPDVTYELIRLVDVEATKFGALTGSQPFQIIEYKLTLADARERWVWPRGGVLTQGEINKEPIDRDAGQDANKNTVLDLYDLCVRCVEAMGLDAGIVPEQLIGRVAPTNLEWRTNHAPTELKKLLTVANCVMAIASNGVASISVIGGGEPPSFPADQRMPTYQVPAVDRRGKTVVFTSAPNANLVTETIKGLHNDEGQELWQFVIQDKDGVWTRIAEAPFWGGGNVITSMKQHFENVEIKFRQRVKDQAYRCIRLNEEVYGPAPILRNLIGGGIKGTVKVRANIAVPGLDDLWIDSYVLVDVNVAGLIEGKILVLGQRLGRVGNSPVDDPDQAFVPLEDDDLEIRLTREAFAKDEGDGAAWLPQYFNVGFRQDLNQIEQLSEDDLKLVLAGPDPTIVRRPDWILVTLDGHELYRAETTAAARAYSPRYLRGSGSVSQICSARGFAAVELNGVTSEVKISQKAAITIAKTNTWWLPSGDNYAEAAELDKPAAAGEKFPAQNHTAAAKTAQGQSGAVQPSVPLLPATPQPAAPGEVLVQITGNAAGGGKYLGGLVSGRSTAKPATDEVMPEGMTSPTDLSVLIVNLREDGEHGHRLPPGYYVGKLVGGADGPIVAIESERCGATETVDLGSTNVTIESADNASEESADRKTVNIWVQSRPAYRVDGDTTLYAFFRRWSFKCGRLTNVTGELRRAVVLTGPCDGGG